MTYNKPQPVPLGVPWMVTRSAPTLRVQATPDGRPLAATFVAYFKLADRRQFAPDAMPQIVREAPPFQPVRDQEQHPYHLVRINFDGGLAYRTAPSFSDDEIVREDDYDWSAVPGALLPDEDALGNSQRRNRFWLEHGIAPDPGVYVVERSPWLGQFGAQANGLHHFLILGAEDYAEVIARAASWEMGQAVD